MCVLKCAGKRRRSAECIVEGFKPGEKALNLNTMLDRMQDNVDNKMDPDSNYLSSVHDRSNVLMMHHCKVKKGARHRARRYESKQELCLSEVR